MCEDGFCLHPGCGTDSQCDAGDQCLNGGCQAAVSADDVADCVVLPQAALLASGSSRRFSVLARNASGKVIPYKGAVSWATGNESRASVSDGVAIGGASAAEVEVLASVGGTSCTAALATNFTATSAHDLRVIVADERTSALIDGAIVTVHSGGETFETTTSDGVALFVGKASDAPRTISVFHDEHYTYLTAVDVRSNDVALYLRPEPVRAGFRGEMGARKFDALSQYGEQVHLAFIGDAFSRNLLDFTLSGLLGEVEETDLDLGGQKLDAPLPKGLIVGIGEQMFRDTYEVRAQPGLRTVWGLGGNVKFNDIISALGPAISDDFEDVEVGDILTQLLPLIGRLQAGALTGQTVVADQMKDVTDDMKLNTLMRLRVNARLPAMPSGLDVAGAVVVGGVIASDGLVPLGLTAGVPREGVSGVIANPEEGGEDNLLPLRMAPRNNGLETGDYAVIALATNLKLGEREAYSALVGDPGELRYMVEGANAFAFRRAFLGIPTAATFDAATRSFSLGSVLPDAHMHRLEMGNEAQSWMVLFPSTVTSIAVPQVSGDRADRFVPKAVLTSAAFRSRVTYESSLSLRRASDGLLAEVEAVSRRAVP